MLKFLGDPYTVAKFQKFCGLSVSQSQASEETSAKECHNGSITSNGNELKANGVKNYREENGKPQSNKKECDERVDPNKTQLFKGELKYNTFIHSMFLFGTELGNELFYITFFPFVYWNLDEYVGRRLVFLWVFTMYFGQVLKELLKWPRPPSPPVIILENSYENEYGMPSTHATVGVMVPFTLVYFSYGRFEYPLVAGVIFFICWCGLVCLSRLYVGVHNIQDLLAGLAIATVTISAALPYLDTTFETLLSYPNAAIIIVIIHISLLVFYPTSDKWTTSRGDTGRILAVGCGCLLASWGEFHVNKMAIPEPYAGPPHEMFVDVLPWLFYSTARFIVGVSILFPVKIVCKAFMHSVLPHLLPESEGNIYKKPTVELPYIFTTYSMIGYFAFYVAPRAFVILGL